MSTIIPTIADTVVATATNVIASVDSGGGPPVEEGGDPDFASVFSLMHMDGANGSTDFKDVALRTWLVSGNSQISTAQSKFGGASGLFDGNLDYISDPVGNIADWKFLHDGTTDYTLEFFYRRDVATAQYMFMTATGGTSTIGIFLRFNADGSIDYRICKGVGGTYELWALAPASSSSILVWEHCAIVYNKTTLLCTIYINGIDVADDTGLNAASSANPEYPMYIGRKVNPTGQYFDGYMDEVRISKIERYTENFTPPTEPFPNAVDPSPLLDAAIALSVDHLFEFSEASSPIADALTTITGAETGAPTYEVTDIASGSPGTVDSNAGTFLLSAAGSMQSQAPWTAFFCIKPIGTLVLGVIWHMGDLGITANQGAWGTVDADGKFTLSWFNSGFKSVTTTSAVFTSDETVHIAVSVAGTDINVYKNGVLEDNLTGANAIISTNQERRLFANTLNNAPVTPLDGEMAYFGYTDSELDATAISDLYDAATA